MLLRWNLITLLLLALCAPLFALADVVIHTFEDPQTRESYLRLTEELRCPKCQNQNLADSNSEMADVMRDVVAEELNNGKNEEQIKSLMVDSYGDFVLYKPPVKVQTIPLWWAPYVLFACVASAFILIVAKRARQAGTDGVDNAELDSDAESSNTQSSAESSSDSTDHK